MCPVSAVVWQSTFVCVVEGASTMKGREIALRLIRLKGGRMHGVGVALAMGGREPWGCLAWCGLGSIGAECMRVLKESWLWNAESP